MGDLALVTARGDIVGEIIGWAVGERLRTPSLVLSPAALRAGVERLRRELGARISYATKANPHPRVLSNLAALVDELNVTNLVHLDQVLDLGVHPSRVTFLHPVLTPTAVAAAADRGVTRFVVDDMRGVRLLRSAGAGMRVTLRLLPPDAGESPRSVVRFGATHGELIALAREAVRSGMELEGLSFFVGTAAAGMAEARPYQRGIEQLARLREHLERDGIPVPAVNIGGGFPGSRRRFHQLHPTFFTRIAALLARLVGADIVTVCEPGRFLAEPAMALLTRVIADRVVAGRRLVHVDVSAYAGLFEHCFIEHGGDRLAIELGRRDGSRTPAAVVGPVMDSFDVIERRADLPPLREGELLVLPNVGAYSWGYMARCEGLDAPAVCELPEQIDGELAARWFE